MEHMPKLGFSVDSVLVKVYYCIKGTGYLTGNVNGCT